MTIHLSEQREQLILSLVRAGKFASAEEVVDEGLRLVEQRLQETGETRKSPISGAAGDTDDRTAQQLGNVRRWVRSWMRCQRRQSQMDCRIGITTG